MSLTNEVSNREKKDSLFLIFAFIPILNSFVFFHLGKQCKKQKWIVLGCITIILQTVLMLLSLHLTILPNAVLKIVNGIYYILKVSQSEQLALISLYSEIIIYIIILFTILINRKKYLNILENESNKRNIKSRLESAEYTVPANTEASETTDKKLNAPIDINSALEDEIATVPGLTIIDAKKAVAYREEHCSFYSKDEFFSVINAKPHIISRVENLIVLGEIKQSKIPNKTDGKRKIDI